MKGMAHTVRKRSLSFVIIILFIVSVVYTESDSVRYFSRFVLSEKESLSSYSTDDRGFICPDIPDQRYIITKPRTSVLTAHNRRNTSVYGYMDVGFAYSHQNCPKDVQEGDALRVMPEREHHPGEDIIRYIHDQDGEKENRILL